MTKFVETVTKTVDCPARMAQVPGSAGKCREVPGSVGEVLSVVSFSKGL